jgi:transcriptional regulator with XRE-family HTH domain
MIDTNKVGETILSCRKKLDLTQIELGELLKVSHQAVSKWERGESLPDIEIMIQLSKLFNITVDQLLTNKEPIYRKNIDMSHCDNDDIWKSTLEIIKDKISKPSFDTWFAHTKGVLEDKSLIITGINQFATEWLYRRYSSLIRKAVDQVSDSDIELIFRISTHLEYSDRNQMA